MIAIVDYGIGNLRSVQKAMEKVGARAQVTQRAEDIRRASKVILPGVGAMRPAMKKLDELGLIPLLKETVREGKPFLGICLGFQLLFERSDEGGDVEGLNILQGRVRRFSSLKVPHMGWNQIKIKSADCALFREIGDLSNVYFCHSYYVQPQDDRIIAATTDYGVVFASSVHSQNIYGVQFHPEKSQAVGLKILGNFHAL
jgi:glutamine amidotransferase